MSKLRANTVIILEYRPAIGVLTPDACDTAERVNAPHVGIDLQQEPIMLHRPSVIISCDASTAIPVAALVQIENELEPKWKQNKID